ncbi:TPA: phage tail protein [Serratia fonticola]
MANNMYYSILTTVGTEKLAQAIITEIPVKITTIAVGDGNGQYYEPTVDQTGLKRETWRGDINDLRSTEDAANHVLAEGVVPANVGGWTVREVGLFDDVGDLIAICNYPDTIKPLPTSGSGKQLYIQIILVVDNVAALELIVDGNIVTASRKYVDDLFDALASYSGFGMVGQCPDIATLRLLEPVQKNKVVNRILVASYYAGANRGGGEFYYDSNDMSSDDDGGFVIVTTGGRRWKRIAGPLSATQFGVRGDGTDETEKVQRLFNTAARRKLVAVIDSDLTVDCHGLVLDERHKGIKIDGQGWIRFYGDGSKQKNKPANLVTGADYCVYMSSISNSEISLRIDGNSVVKIDNEQIHSIGLFGGKNINFPTLKFRNTRGDGIYITQSNGNVESAIPENISLGYLESINDDFDGRNAASIISVKKLTYDTIVSLRHGGKVGGVYQPGGLDIEPNYYYQKCFDITGKSYTALCGGSQGLTIAGKQPANDPGENCVKNVHLGFVNVELTDTGRGAGRVILLNGVNDVFIEGFAKTTENYIGEYVGLHAVGVTGVRADISTRRCKHAAWIGYQPILGLRNVYASDFKIAADRYHDGVSVGWSDSNEIDFVGMNPTQMGSNGDMGHLQFIANPGESTPIRRTTVKVRGAGYDGYLERLDYGVRVSQAQTPAIYKGTVKLIDSDLTNVLHAPASGKNRLLGTKDIIKSNIVGVTPYPGTPIDGVEIWGYGDIVFDSNVSSNNIVGRVYTSTGWQIFSQLPSQLPQ